MRGRERNNIPIFTRFGLWKTKRRTMLRTITIMRLLLYRTLFTAMGLGSSLLIPHLVVGTEIELRNGEYVDTEHLILHSSPPGVVTKADNFLEHEKEIRIQQTEKRTEEAHKKFKVPDVQTAETSAGDYKKDYSSETQTDIVHTLAQNDAVIIHDPIRSSAAPPKHTSVVDEEPPEHNKHGDSTVDHTILERTREGIYSYHQNGGKSSKGKRKGYFDMSLCNVTYSGDDDDDDDLSDQIMNRTDSRVRGEMSGKGGKGGKGSKAGKAGKKIRCKRGKRGKSPFNTTVDDNNDNDDEYVYYQYKGDGKYGEKGNTGEKGSKRGDSKAPSISPSPTRMGFPSSTTVPIQSVDIDPLISSNSTVQELVPSIMTPTASMGPVSAMNPSSTMEPSPTSNPSSTIEPTSASEPESTMEPTSTSNPESPMEVPFVSQSPTTQSSNSSLLTSQVLRSTRLMTPFTLEYNYESSKSPLRSHYSELADLTAQFVDRSFINYYDGRNEAGYLESFMQFFYIREDKAVEFMIKSEFESDKSVPSLEKINEIRKTFFDESGLSDYVKMLKQLDSDNIFHYTKSVIETGTDGAITTTPGQLHNSHQTQSRNKNKIIVPLVAVGTTLLTAIVAIFIYNTRKSHYSVKDEEDAEIMRLDEDETLNSDHRSSIENSLYSPNTSPGNTSSSSPSEIRHTGLRSALDSSSSTADENSVSLDFRDNLEGRPLVSAIRRPNASSNVILCV